MADYVRPAVPWENLPVKTTPVTAEWLNGVDDALTDLAGAGGRVSDLETGKVDRSGDTVAGRLAVNATGAATVDLPGGYGNSTAHTGLVVASSYPSDDVAGGTDGTGRINLYSYQRANAYSFGEVARIFGMRKDSKQMIAWYAPKLGYDPVTREPVAGTSWTPVTWIGTHWESNGHTGNHKHWEIEIPDSQGALHGRFEVLFGNLGDESIGLDKTKILTNLTDFVVRCKSTNPVDGTDLYQALRLAAAAGFERAIEFSVDTDGVVNRWKLRSNSVAETGGNAGADFEIVRYADNGAYLGAALKITRNTGVVTADTGLSVPNGGLGIGTNASVSKGSVQVSRPDSGVVVQGTQAAAGAFSPVFLAIGQDTGAKGFQAQVAGDSTARLSIGTDGKIEMGSGSATRDTNLYRSGANQLATDDSFTVGGDLKVTGKAGFYGTTPTAQPVVTGSRSDGTALASLLSALSALGLITDSTQP